MSLLVNVLCLLVPLLLSCTWYAAWCNDHNFIFYKKDQFVRVFEKYVNKKIELLIIGNFSGYIKDVGINTDYVYVAECQEQLMFESNPGYTHSRCVSKNGFNLTCAVSGWQFYNRIASKNVEEYLYSDEIYRIIKKNENIPVFFYFDSIGMLRDMSLNTKRPSVIYIGDIKLKADYTYGDKVDDLIKKTELIIKNVQSEKNLNKIVENELNNFNKSDNIQINKLKELGKREKEANDIIKDIKQIHKGYLKNVKISVEDNFEEGKKKLFELYPNYNGDIIKRLLEPKNNL